MLYAVVVNGNLHLAYVVMVVRLYHIASLIPVGMLQVELLALTGCSLYNRGMLTCIGHGDKRIFILVQVHLDRAVGQLGHGVVAQAMAGIVEDVEVYLFYILLDYALLAIGQVFQVDNGVPAVATVFANAGGEQQEEQSQDPPQPSLKGREQCVRNSMFRCSVHSFFWVLYFVLPPKFLPSVRGGGL